MRTTQSDPLAVRVNVTERIGDGSEKDRDDAGTPQDVNRVPLSALRDGVSPRLGGEDANHVRVLADIFEKLPPIVVNRDSMTVIDGYHRVRAARLLQLTDIPAVMFEGDEADAYLESVRLNIAHGKPLTTRERERAATQIAKSHPDWSDRRLAELCGLSPKTVARARESSSEENPHLTTRIGRDQKRRSTDPVALRVKIAEHLETSPNDSLDAVARATGSSRGTVRDVRERLRTHRDVVPQGLKRRSRYSNLRAETADVASNQAVAAPVREKARSWPPTLAGFAQWFAATDVQREACQAYVSVIPVENAGAVVDEARRRAETWNRFADDVRRRTR